MKEKTKLRLIQVLCVISLIFTVFSIERTYAKYFEKVGTTYSTDIKKWIINVNTKSIHNEETLEEVMTPVIRDNIHMNNNNTFVPGREGYFEFLIDYSKVDLAFRFDFDIKQLNTKTITTEGEEGEVIETIEDNFLSDFEIYGYSIVKEGNVEIIRNITPNNLSELSQIIDPTIETDTDKKMQLRILFRWNDSNMDTEDDEIAIGMNNYEDTMYAGNIIEDDIYHTNLNYRVKITFTQNV